MQSSYLRLALLLALCLYTVGCLAALQNQPIRPESASHPVLQISNGGTVSSPITEITLERVPGWTGMPEPRYQLILRADGTATLITVGGQLKNGTYHARISPLIFQRLAQYMLDCDFGNYQPFYGPCATDIPIVTTSVVYKGHRKTVEMWGSGKGWGNGDISASEELIHIQDNIDKAMTHTKWERIKDDWRFHHFNVDLHFYFGDWPIPENATQEQLSVLLILAVEHENVSMVKALLARKADPNAGEGSDRIIMHGQIPKSSISLFPNRRWPVLMLAAGRENPKIARLLLEAGADVHARLDNGCTALLAAAYVASIEATEHQHPWPRSAETIKLLIQFGADVNAKDQEGNTALSEAKGDPVVVSILKQAGERE